MTLAQSQTYDPSDSLVLLAIDAACDASNNLNWNSESFPAFWEGVSWNDENPKRVVRLNLIAKELTETLDVGPLTCLNSMLCYNNNLTSLNVTGLMNLTYLDCRNNHLSFASIERGYNYYYSPQGKVQKSETDITINYSSYALNEDSTTYFEFFKDGIQVEVNTTGIFTTNGVSEYYCSLTNTKYPGVTITIAEVIIQSPVPTYSQTDCQALLAIDAACDGSNNLNWDSEPDPCNWEGVTWNSYNVRRVKELIIPYKLLTGGLNVSDLKQLRVLFCNDNQLSSLNASGLKELTNLYCGWNQLTSLNVSGLSNILVLECGLNNLANLDVSSCANLIDLDVSYNQLTYLEISHLLNLVNLNCYENQLIDLDASHCVNLINLLVAQNQLSSLNILNLSKLEYLSVNENYLTSMDVSMQSNLRRLECAYNQLTSLDGLSIMNNLNYFYCDSNQLTSLDLSSLVNLENFSCNFNQLINLDASNCINLLGFCCSSNQLTNLNVLKLSKLEGLSCSNNKLTSLDVTSNVNLFTLYCDMNHFSFSLLPPEIHSIQDCQYSPQNVLYEPMIINGNTTFDYSSEAAINDSLTHFVFYKNDSIAEINTSGIFTTNGNGVYHCTMTNGLFPDLTLTTATVTVAGVDEMVKDLFKAICPNPAKDRVFITCPEEIEQVSVYSLTGSELIKATDISGGIDLSGLFTGIYLIRVAGKGQQQVQKIVIE